MNKTIVLLLIFIIPCISYSQDFSGITAGVTFSKIKGDAVVDSVSISNKVGFRLGMEVEFKLSDKVYVQTAIEYCGKGYKAKDPVHTNVVTMEYVQIPISLIAKLPLDEDKKIQILAGAGGYVGFGITFRSKFTTRNSNGDETSVNSGDFADYGIRLIDLGLHTVTGVQIGKKIQITFNYQPGLQTLFYSDDFGVVKNRVMSLQVGYDW